MSVSALDLLKTSAYSCYSSGIEERLIFSEMAVDLAYTVKWNWRANIFEPDSCEAQSRAGALIIVEVAWG